MSIILWILIIIQSATTSNLRLELLYKEQQQQKEYNGNIQNLLIHPSKNVFAEYILPHLSPEGVLQTYEHFKKSYPNLDLPTFLDAYHVPSNIVWSLEEECKFYPFLARKTTHFSLFSKKTGKPIIFESVLFPNAGRDDVIFALLPSKKIIPFQFRTYGSRHGLMLAKNPDGYDFFIALLKADGEFSVVAHGAAHEVNISQNLHLIWESYNSKKESFSLNCIRRVTIPYLRYLRSLQICYANLLKKCCSAKWINLILRVVLFFFFYNTAYLPFSFLSFFIDFLTNSQGTLSFVLNGYLPFLFFSTVTFPFMINVVKSFREPEYFNIFAIKPHTLMWRFPLLMQRENVPDFAGDAGAFRDALSFSFLFFTHTLIFLWPFIIYFLTLFFSENINGEGNSCPSWVTDGGKYDCQFYQDNFWWSCTKYMPTAKIDEWHCY